MSARPGPTAHLSETDARLAGRVVHGSRAVRAFQKRSPSTQEKYKDGLACLEDVYDAPLAELRTHDVVLWRDKVEKKKWPAFANKMVTALSTMFSLAKERGWIDTNPAKGIRRTYKSNKNSNREWLPPEWATVMERAPMHLKIAYMIARHLGYRSQSTVAVEWENYQPDPRFGMCFRMHHRKNDEEGHWLPASPELQAFLATSRSGPPRARSPSASTASPGRARAAAEAVEQLPDRAGREGPSRPRPDRARPARHLRRRDQARHRRQ